MLKVKIYGDENEPLEEACELLAVCGFSRPGKVIYQLRADFRANKKETFESLAHLSAQLQAAARDAMQEAIQVARSDGVELNDEFMKDYEKTVYDLEKRINRNVGPDHGKKAAEDDADD